MRFDQFNINNNFLYGIVNKLNTEETEFSKLNLLARY